MKNKIEIHFGLFLKKKFFFHFGTALTFLAIWGFVGAARNDYALALTDSDSDDIICTSDGCYPIPRSPVNLVVLNPPRGAIREQRPTFSWLAVEGANHYTVSLKSSGRLLWQQTVVMGTQLVYPRSEADLEFEKDYDLIIESNDRRGTTRKVRFRTLSQAQIQTVEMQLQSIRDRALDADEKTLTIAELYLKPEYDLVSDAILLLNKAINDRAKSLPIYLKLGKLYLEQVQAPSLAQPVYQQALELARSTLNLSAQAESRVGLARVALAPETENWELGIQYLEAAYENYKMAVNKELEAAQVAQFIGETYFRQEKHNRAIFWYQTALESYKTLKQQDYVNAIERVLEELQ